MPHQRANDLGRMLVAKSSKMTKIQHILITELSVVPNGVAAFTCLNTSEVRVLWCFTITDIYSCSRGHETTQLTMVLPQEHS